MSATLEFFPVDNGDMTLIRFESGRTLLIDCNIRKDADDKDDDTPDVASYLRDRLDTDDQGRHFVDAFILSHPDEDHCRGLDTHFHLGDPGSWVEKDSKIIINEMWSSPIVFRRKDRIGSLCADAESWRQEARRRVKRFRDGYGDEDGDRILILGEDIDGKSDGLEDILIRLGKKIEKINGSVDGTFAAILHGPLAPGDDEDDEECLAKNRSSVILRFEISADGVEDAGLFLTGGDAEVAIWERLWSENASNADVLNYDVLQAPHHCSWHSLSYDSWSDKGEEAEVSTDARSALSQALENAIIVSSSKKISDDDSDPPCIRAKREYEDILEADGGEFLCVAEHVADEDVEVLLITISKDGVVAGGSSNGSNTAAKAGVSGTMKKTEKRGGGRYAGRFA